MPSLHWKPLREAAGKEHKKNEMKKIMPQTVGVKGPIYIRLARGGDKMVTKKIKNIKIGKAILFGDPKDILFVTTGITTQECLEVTEILKKIK